MTLAELRARWREDAAVLRRRGAGQLADSLEGCAAELETALAAEASAPLTVAEAAAESGYSAAQLRRLFPGQRTIPRGELPRKGIRAPRDGVAALVNRLVAR